MDGKQDTIPPALNDWLYFEQYNLLPKAGGIDNQPMTRFLEMEESRHTYQALKLFNSAEHVAQFSQDHPGLVKFCLDIKRWQDD